MFTFTDYKKSTEYIRQNIGDFVPDVAVILGSGLGPLAGTIDAKYSIDYKDIPNFRASTAIGHAGRLIFGTLGDKNVVAMQGRLHYYEGYSQEEITYPIRVLKLLGATKLIVTNASGGVNPYYLVGDLVLITDQIKTFGESPLRGANIDEFGDRFPDCTFLYTPRLQKLALKVADELDITLKQGVYMYFAGPQYETPAEIHMARAIGADLVGMSTAPEVIVAAHCGFETLGVSLVCNAAAGMSGNALSGQEVLDAAEAAKVHFSSFISACIEAL